MSTLRILSWNVNGIRAIARKGFHGWLNGDNPDILCIQETKAHPDQLDENLRKVPGYFTYYESAERKGYSGTAIFSKPEPLQVIHGIGDPVLDSEGRTLAADFGEFILYSVYFPNGKASPERLKFKMDFYDAFLKHVESVRKRGKHIIICGDVNTAHKEIDLARPKENSKVSGFLPEERAWIDTLLSHGYCDTFRIFNQKPGQYSWWDYKTRARDRNIGWRIDYFFIDEGFRGRLKEAFILKDIEGSDHCPIGISITT